MMNIFKDHIRSNVAAFYSIVTWYMFSKNVFVVSQSQGDSMLPTVEDGSVLFVDRFMYKWKGLKRDDIIVATQPVDPNVTVCKRIKFVAGDVAYGMTVPENCVWLEGDNPEQSFDSRKHGPVPVHLIQGRVLSILKM